MIEDVIEREVIEHSHLVRARCACGAVALVAETYAGEARCGECIRRDTGAGQGWAELFGRYTPVVGYPLGSGRAPVAQIEPFPAPEWTSRDSGAPEVPAPGAALALAVRARSAGWTVRQQCSRGSRPHGTTGHPLAVKTLWAVLLRHERGAAAYAIHDGATWASVMLWGARVPWFPHATITDLDTFVITQGDVGEEWFAGIRARVGESAERTKARAACNRGVHPLAETAPMNSRVILCPTCGNSWTLGDQPWRKPKVGKSEAL